MWERLLGFIQTHYKSVLVFNLALILFIGTAVYYGIIRIKELDIYNQIVAEAGLEENTTEPTSSNGWFGEDVTGVSKEYDATPDDATTENAEKFETEKNSTTEDDLYVVLNKLFPKKIIDGSADLESRKKELAEIFTEDYYSEYVKSALTDAAIDKYFALLVSVSYSYLDKDNPEAFCEITKGEDTYYYQVFFEKTGGKWLINKINEYSILG